jgi:hypothetical protein
VGSGHKNARVGGTNYWQSREEIATIIHKWKWQKRTQGKSLWNKEGMQYFGNAEIKWREIYDSEKDMKILYNGWET